MHTAPTYVCPNCPSESFFYYAGTRYETGAVKCSYCLTKAVSVPADDPIVPFGVTRQIEELERMYGN